MSRKKAEQCSPEESAVLESVDLGSAELDLSSVVTSVRDDTPAPPSITEPGWQSYVMGLFTDDELDPNNRPLVHGLRRVVQLVMGPIVSSSVRVVQAPAFTKWVEKASVLEPAVCECTVQVLVSRPDYGLDGPTLVTFTEAADAYFGNTDKEFARYLTALAATRAEGRCLRKLLRLRSIAAEEAAGVPALEVNVNGLIDDTQMNFIDMVCRRCDIDVMAFVNSGRKKNYASIEEVPCAVALKMCECLSGYQNKRSSIPEELRGYDSNWK